MTENPLNNVRRYVREQLREANPSFINAVKGFVEQQYWDDNNIGDPERNGSIAIKNALKLGFNEDDLEKIREDAQRIVARFKESSGLESGLDLGRIQEAALQVQRRREYRVRMAGRFAKMMSHSDDEIRRQNSNTRVAFMEDPVYGAVGIEGKRKFKNRAFKEDDYAIASDKIKRVSEVSGLVSLDISKRDEINWDVLEPKVKNGLQVLVEMGKMKKGKAISKADFIIMVLKGEIVTPQALGVYGFEPGDIKTQAQKFYSSYRIQEEDVKKLRRYAARRKIDKELDPLGTGRPFELG